MARTIVCRNHGVYPPNHCHKYTPCPAISLKGWLRRKGYAYGQYQGTVKTDAGRETIRQWADQFVARYHDDGLVGLDAFNNIPRSVLALLGMANKDAPPNGWGCGYPIPARGQLGVYECQSQGRTGLDHLTTQL